MRPLAPHVPRKTEDGIWQVLADSIVVPLSLLNADGVNGSILCEVPLGRHRRYILRQSLFPFGGSVGVGFSGIITILELISLRFD